MALTIRDMTQEVSVGDLITLAGELATDARGYYSPYDQALTELITQAASRPTWEVHKSDVYAEIRRSRDG